MLPVAATLAVLDFAPEAKFSVPEPPVPFGLKRMEVALPVSTKFALMA